MAKLRPGHSGFQRESSDGEPPSLFSLGLSSSRAGGLPYLGARRRLGLCHLCEAFCLQHGLQGRNTPGIEWGEVTGRDGKKGATTYQGLGFLFYQKAP
jgi:hypothetical protein